MRPTRAIDYFILSVIALASVLLVAYSRDVSWALWPQILLFLALIVLPSYLHAQDPAGGVVSSTALLFYVAIYVFTPITTFVVVALGYAIGNTFPRRWVTWRVCFNGAQMGLSALIGSVVYRLLGGDIASTDLARQVIPTVLGPVAHQMANNFFVAFPISQMRGTGLARTWLSFIQEILWSNLLSIPTAALIAMLYTRVHHGYVLIFLFSLPFQRWAMRLYLSSRSTYTRVIEALVTAGELSLPRTRGHARRVADLTVAIGRRMGMIERDVESFEFAALLHDVGMIGLDSEIMSESAYTKSQELIVAHSNAGADIVAELPRRGISEMVRDHHVPFNAQRPIRHSRREGLYIGARIIALAEDVDSRLHGLFPYREPQGLSVVIEAIVDDRGKRFDPSVVDAFLSALKDMQGSGTEDAEAEQGRLENLAHNEG